MENGLRLQRIVAEMLALKGYRRVRAGSIEGLLQAKNALFAERGCYAEQCDVPLVARCHARHKWTARVDFAVLAESGEVVLLSIKHQQVNGTADEKIEHEIRQLMATEHPAAILVHGPLRGRDGREGWRAEVLCPVWERTLDEGRSRILLFRTEERLARWIGDGMPVGGRGTTTAAVFAEYCDREP